MGLKIALILKIFTSAKTSYKTSMDLEASKTLKCSTLTKITCEILTGFRTAQP
jgi:hypothetical protein